MRISLHIAFGAAVLTACAPAAERSAPAAAAGSVTVAQDGAIYLIDLRAGPPGEALTRAGAVAVPGLTLAVRREGRALGQDEGLAAKTAAAEACAMQGGRHNPTAIGRYAGGGTWAFAGGCA